MSVHYDIEASSARLRVELAKVATDERSTPGSRIKFRNPEAIIAINELIMQELNRGTPHEDIVDAVIEVTTDMLFSLSGGNRADLLHNAPEFIMRFQKHLLRRATSTGINPGARVAPIFEPGGHA